jgi:hypothetical protein
MSKVKTDGVDARKPFYVAMCIDNQDGSLSGEWPLDYIGIDEGEAVAALKSVCDEHRSSDGYVFKCIPVKRVWRGRLRVEAVPKATG